MRRFFVLIGLVLPFALSGCGGASSNTANMAVLTSETPGSEPAPASAAPIPIDSLTDAPTALAEGKRLLDENQTEAAIKALEKAISLDADLAEAHFNLGIAYDLLELQMEQSGVAVETFSSTVTNSKTKKKEKVLKTKADLAFEAAVKAYEKWLDKNPKDDNAHFYLGRTYAKLMKDEQARDAFKEAVELKPDDAEYQTEYGAILMKLAQYAEAIKPLKKALELDPSNPRAADLLEDAEAGRQRIDYAVKEAEKNANSKQDDQPDKGTSSPKSSSNSASNSASTPSNSVPKPPNSDPKPKKPDTEPKTKKGDPDGRPRISP
jgi:tetratricopeptide (TPR) repeat protein